MRRGLLLVLALHLGGCQVVADMIEEAKKVQFENSPSQKPKTKSKVDKAPKPKAPEPEDDEEDDDTPPTKVPAPVVKANVVDLGVAAYPKPTDGTPAAFSFKVPTLAPSQHKVGYDLDPDERKAIGKFYKDYAKSVSWKRLDEKSFSWKPPAGCETDMHCVYATLAKRNKPDIEVLTARFRARAEQQKLNALQTAQLVMAFVQAVPYEIPDDPFGIKPPALVLAERRGDCDSKSLLGHVILKSLGVDTVIVSSQAHAHTLLGIALPASGTTFKFKGTNYAFAETTAIGSPIGFMNPDLKSPSDWRVEYGP